MSAILTRDQLKHLLIEILSDTDVLGFHDAATGQAFLAGNSEVPLADLNIDSLAAMEICIAVELELGLTLVPAQLMHMSTLMDVVRWAEEKQS